MKNLLMLVIWILSGNHAFAEQPSDPGVAFVSNGIVESMLTTLTLSPDAVRRLGIETSTVERQKVNSSQTLGGRLIIPPGHIMTVEAASSGMVFGPDRGEVLPAGTTLEGGDVVMLLLPLPSDSELQTSGEDIVVREAQLEFARSQFERVKRLFEGGSGSQQQFEEAQSALISAEAALSIARNRQSILVGDESYTSTPLVLKARENSVISKVHITAGQLVAASTPLFELQNQSTLWVRVPIYSSGLQALKQNSTARVGPLGHWGANLSEEVRPIQGPPSANALAASVDLYFELNNSDYSYRAGETVQVQLELKDSGEQLVVPWSAIFSDINGASWVYVEKQSGVYVRTRVLVNRVAGELAILERGPSIGSQVVSVGVAELTGVEFGVDH